MPEWSSKAEAKHQLVDKEEKRMVNMAPSAVEVSKSWQEGLEILAFKTSPGTPTKGWVIQRGWEVDLNLSVATEITKMLVKALIKQCTRQTSAEG